jgi:hypothetical protein
LIRGQIRSNLWFSTEQISFDIPSVILRLLDGKSIPPRVIICITHRVIFTASPNVSRGIPHHLENVTEEE